MRITRLRVASGVQNFAETAYKALDLPPWEPGTVEPTLFMGFYSNADYQVALQHPGAKLLMFCGTDARFAKEAARHLNAMRRPYGRVIAGPSLQRSLDAAGVKVDHWHGVFVGHPEMIEPRTPLGRAIYCYCPFERRAEYGIHALTEVAQRFPDTPFYLARWGNQPKPFENATPLPEWLTRQELAPVYRNSRAMLRCNDHDGFCTSIVELALCGRPGMSTVNYGLDWLGHARTTDDLCEFLEKALAMTEPDIALADTARAYIEDRWFLEVSEP